MWAESNPCCIARTPGNLEASADPPFLMPARRSSALADAVTTSLVVVGVLFLATVVQVVFRVPLAELGIVPRTLRGLVGIIFSPCLHASFSHVAANVVPLFVLLVMLLSDRSYQPWRTLAWIWGMSGLGTWLIGRGDSVHVGASSIVFGLAAFLIVAGLRLRSWRSLVVAVVVVVFYGGIFYGALPHRGPISWEGHLSGMVAGVWIAVRNGGRKKAR